jgi:hypothetical protein
MAAFTLYNAKANQIIPKFTKKFGASVCLLTLYNAKANQNIPQAPTKICRCRLLAAGAKPAQTLEPSHTAALAGLARPTIEWCPQCQPPWEGVRLYMAPEEPPQGLLEELVERYRLGDAQAGEQLLRDRKLRQKVEILARQKTKDTPVSWQDAAQVAYIKIIVGVRRPKFSWLGVPQFYKWAEQAASSAINDLIRKEKRLRGGSFQEPSLDAPLSGEDTEGETLTLGDTIPDEKFSEAVKLAESVEEVGTAVEQIDRRYPKKGYLALWRGLVQEKDLSQIAAALGVKQPEISKRWRELSSRIAGELGLLTLEQVEREVRAIRQGSGKGRKRSDTQW